MFEQTDKILSDGLSAQRYTAAVIQVADRERLLFSKAYGILDPQAPQNIARVDSIFDLASLTKLFVATAVMRLVESEELRLETPISTIIPSFSGGHKSDITVFHLLTHVSGLPASFDVYSTGEWKRGPDAVFDRLYETNLIAMPGEQVVYSCLGFILLGRVLETVTRAPLNQCLNELLFEPAGWTQIGYCPSPASSLHIAVTEYKTPFHGQLSPGVVHDEIAFALGGISGNAGIFSGAEPLTALGQQCLLAWRNASAFPISSATIRQMTSEVVHIGDQRRGLGWLLNSGLPTESGGPFSLAAFGHTGFTGTSVWIDPYANVVVTLLTNRVYYGGGKLGSVKFNPFRSALHSAVLADLQMVEQ